MNTSPLILYICLQAYNFYRRMNNRIKITHDLSDFHEGEELILTLKDQHLLKGD